ncbi:MAG: LptF/LptG family permease, partial [Nitrospirae bacterium]|nr:LptF/LptG family permease [Nitrospirota bacterium]
PTLILAQEGTLLSDPASDRVGLRLMNGSQHREIGGLPSTRPPAAAGPPDLPDRQAGGQEQESPSRYQWITFGRYEFKLDLAAVVKRASGEDGAAPNVRQLKEKFAGGQPMERRELRTLEEHYKTYAFPFSCLIFGMIGIPLGLAIKQGGRLGGFALGIAMALIYYLMMIIADFLATALVFTPLAAAWFPNLIMASLALFLAAGSNRGLFTRHGGFTRWFRSGGR